MTIKPASCQVNYPQRMIARASQEMRASILDGGRRLLKNLMPYSESQIAWFSSSTP